MAMIYAVGDVSGAHLNPAVAVGIWPSRRRPGRDVPVSVAGQAAGALTASGLLLLIFPDHPTLGATAPAGSALRSFVSEVAFTLFLLSVILTVSSGPREKGIMAGIAVGGVIAFEAFFAGPIVGASMNPVRSLAPAVAAGVLGPVW